jgi:ASC-1-like (ASCH) protein
MPKTKKHLNKKHSSCKKQRVKKMPGLDFQPKYSKNVGEPWFTLISLGLKKVEGRLDKGSFAEMAVGDVVKWTNNDFGLRQVITRIKRKTKYSSFREYLESECLSNCLPGFSSLDQGVAVYRKYYSMADEAASGVVAIEFEILLVI